MTSKPGDGLIRLLGAATIGYLTGTLPSADLAARVATRGAVKLRDSGSGNPGAANAASLLGSRWGAAVMAADISKGFAACRVGGFVAGEPGAYVAGTAAVLGHCYPVWTRFRGGKGVATSVGQCLATFPVYFPSTSVWPRSARRHAGGNGRSRRRASRRSPGPSLASRGGGVAGRMDGVRGPPRSCH